MAALVETATKRLAIAFGPRPAPRAPRRQRSALVIVSSVHGSGQVVGRPKFLRSGDTPCERCRYPDSPVEFTDARAVDLARLRLRAVAGCVGARGLSAP